MFRVAVDIDGILTNETAGHDYASRTPNAAAIKLLNALQSVPAVVVYLFTARRPEDLDVTVDWLRRVGVRPIPEIRFDKPQYNLLVDDLAV